MTDDDLFFQTPHQILSHLSWAHAFVVVYDVTSRTSFTHAKKLLHIIHSCSHTPLHLPFSFSSKACPCRANDIPLRWDIFHERTRNESVCLNSDETVNDNEDLSANAETSTPSLYFVRGASRTRHPVHRQPQIVNHNVYTCYEVEPRPTAHGRFTSSSIPVPASGRRGHVRDEWRRTRRPDAGVPHRAVSPCYDSPHSTSDVKHLQHCPCYSHHTTLRSSTTTNNGINNYKATLFPSYGFCDSAENVPVTDHVLCDNCEDKNWSLSETAQRTPLHTGRSFETCDERQKYKCIYERYTKSSSHSCDQLLPDHATLGHHNGMAVRGGCVPPSTQRKHTTLLLGNKRDLEHIR